MPTGGLLSYRQRKSDWRQKEQGEWLSEFPVRQHEKHRLPLPRARSFSPKLLCLCLARRRRLSSSLETNELHGSITKLDIHRSVSNTDSNLRGKSLREEDTTSLWLPVRSNTGGSKHSLILILNKDMQYVCRHVASVATGIRLVWCKFSRGFGWDKISLCSINQNIHRSS